MTSAFSLSQNLQLNSLRHVSHITNPYTVNPLMLPGFYKHKKITQEIKIFNSAYPTASHHCNREFLLTKFWKTHFNNPIEIEF